MAYTWLADGVRWITKAYQNLITARALHSSVSSTSKAPFEILDMSALAAGIRVRAGLPGFDSSLVRSLLPVIESRHACSDILKI